MILQSKPANVRLEDRLGKRIGELRIEHVGDVFRLADADFRDGVEGAGRVEAPALRNRRRFRFARRRRATAAELLGSFDGARAGADGARTMRNDRQYGKKEAEADGQGSHCGSAGRTLQV